jgi:hypothetical protein
MVQIEATVTNTPGTGTIGTAPLGPWNLLRRATVRINLGTSVLYSASGWTNYVLQRLSAGGVDFASAGSDVFAFSTASGDQALRLTYLIPLSPNQGEDFSVGLVNLQAPEIQCTLDLEFGALVGDAYTVSGNATVVYKAGTQPTAKVSYLYYEVPDPNRVLYPPLVFHRVIEDELPLPAGGEQVYTWPREGIVLQQIITLLNNTPARTDALDRLVVRANKTDEFYRIDRWAQRALDVTRYELPLPTGVFCLDFWSSKGRGEVGWGDTRDAVNTEAVATLETILGLASTFTPGSNARAMITRRILQFVAA